VALLRLARAAEVRLSCAPKRIETPRPAGSSPGERSFDPEESRARDFVSSSEDSSNRLAAA